MGSDGADPYPPRIAAAALLPLALLLVIIGIGLWLALGLEPLAGKAPPARTVGEITIVRDVLTGRPVDENGVPVPPESGPGSRDDPLEVRFVPSADVGQASAVIRHLLDFAERRTGYYIRGAILRSYGLVVEELVQGKCDVAFLTAASYARARYATGNNTDPDDEIEAILQVVRRGNPEYPGADLAYRAILIVQVDSPLQSARDLTDEHAVAMGNVTSGASSILPTAYFRQLGVTPRVQRYEGYPIIVNAVLQGAVDVGSIWWSPPNKEKPINDARQLVLEMDPLVMEKTRILDMTPWIPNAPVVVRSALPDRVKHELARVFSLYVALKTLTLEGRDELVHIGSPAAFIPASNDDFLPLMEVIEQAFADDPEGRRDFMAGSK